MAAPATTGQLRTKIGDMEIGDYIICNYNRSTVRFALNDATGGEIPLTGVSAGATFAYFYFVKIDRGLLMGDRVISNSVSWDALNSGKFIEGLPAQLDGDTDITSGVLRSPSGGAAYADANGNSSTTDKGFGAWPTNNEWDKCIANFPSELIQSGKALDDVFHYTASATLTKDTLATNSSYRVQRGRSGTDPKIFLGSGASNGTWSNVGFRPVFEYKEV